MDKEEAYKVLQRWLIGERVIVGEMRYAVMSAMEDMKKMRDIEYTMGIKHENNI